MGQEQPAVRLGALPYLSLLSKCPRLVIQQNPRAGDIGCEQKRMVQKNGGYVTCELVC